MPFVDLPQKTVESVVDSMTELRNCIVEQAEYPDAGHFICNKVTRRYIINEFDLIIY